MSEGIGNLLSGALVGLDSNKCVAWECQGSSRFFGESLVGKNIEQVFPDLSGRLHTQSEISVSCPERPAVFVRALPSRTSGETYAWYVRFTLEHESGAMAQLNAALRERTALAQVMHDGPHQVLTALLLRMGQLSVSVDEKTVQEVLELADKAAHSLQQVTSELSPPRAPGGLCARLTILATLAERHLDMLVSVPCNDRTLYPQNIEDALVGGVQRLLACARTNAIFKAALSIHETNDALRVVLEFEDFTGDLERFQCAVQCDQFARASGQITTEMESKSAAIRLQFPLSDPPTTELR